MDEGRTDTGEVPRLLHRVRGGDREAFDRLLPLVYDELRRVARGQLRRDWLRGECGDDGGLYREVEEMLSAHGESKARFPSATACLLALRREIGDQRGIAFALDSLAWAEQYHGAHTRALALLEKAQETLAPVQDRLMVSFGRLIRCRVLRDRGWLDRAASVVAVRLLGAAEGLREEVEAFAGPVWLRRVEERAEELERRLGGERFETLRRAGRDERWAVAGRGIG